MDKSDYSEVKELITTNSKCATNSPFDGDSVVFYGSTKDETFQKGGHLRSFRKIGADNAGRHDLKGTYNNQRSEKDPSAWAMVHDGGHGLHFAEAAADIAFVTKNALALRDAHSKESLTAPFKSIQIPASEKPTAAEESRPASKHPHGNAPSARTAATGLVTATNHGTNHHTTTTTTTTTNNNNNNNNSNPNPNIFSFNSSRNVKAVVTDAASEPYDDDSNFEKESTASFDFNRHRASANPLTKPTPSKWDDAEKWLSAGESAPAKTRPRNSPLAAAATTTSESQRKGEAYPNPEVDPDGSASDGEMVPDMSPEKMNKFLVNCTTTKKVEAPGSKKSLLPRFAFLASAGKPLPLPLPAATVDRYPLEDVFGRDDSNARDSSDAAHHHEPFSVRTAKPTAGVTIDSAGAKTAGNNNVDEATKDASCDAGAVYAEPGAVVNMRTVCMRDMGTEMTPMASVDPSRTATPLMATTPNLGSPAISRPCSPGRVRNTTPASGSKVVVDAGKANGLSGKEKTRAEILALGTQLGKANIAAWATKEEEEADAAQALKASLEMEEVRKNLLASRAAAWEEAEQAKYTARFKREEAKIQAWENHEKAKAEAEMRRVERNMAVHSI